MSRLILSVSSDVRDSIFNSLLSYSYNNPIFVYGLLHFPNAISHMIIITNNTIWKIEHRRQNRYYCLISETENVKLRLVVVIISYFLKANSVPTTCNTLFNSY